MEKLVSFTPNEHDVEVVRDGWRYWVRGVKSGQPLKSDLFNGGGSLLDELMDLVAGSMYRRWLAQRSTWKVGVLAFRDNAWGGLFKIRHKEVLTPGVLPHMRIAELVAEVEAGRFHR